MQPSHCSFRRTRAHRFVVTALDRHEQELARMQAIGQGGVAEARRSLSRQFRRRIHAFRIVNETAHTERVQRKAGGSPSPAVDSGISPPIVKAVVESSLSSRGEARPRPDPPASQRTDATHMQHPPLSRRRKQPE